MTAVWIIAIVASIVAVLLAVIVTMCLYTIMVFKRELEKAYSIINFYTGGSPYKETEEDQK